MSQLDLNSLTKIREKGKTQKKTTSLYRDTSKLNSRKYRLIIKQYTFNEHVNKPYLLKTQFQKIGCINTVNMIKDVQIYRFDDKQKVRIIEKYQQYGVLTERILPDQMIDIELLKVLAQGVRQLHKNDVMHLNLKPQNIFIKRENIIKFTDFQTPYLSSLIRKDKNMTKISNYIPPQAGQDHIICKKWDVWALGVIFLQLITHQLTKPQKEPLISLIKIVDTVKDQHLKQLIKRMICKRQQRMNIEEVVNCLNQGIQYFDHKEGSIKNVSINFDLFTQVACFQPIQKYLKNQTIHRKISNWILCFTLLQIQSKQHQLWISLQNQSKYTQTSFNYVYSSMTQNIKEYFKDWYHFFTQLKQTKTQDYQLNKDGFLRIKMKVNIQQRQQQVKKQIKNQFFEQKKKIVDIKEQIKFLQQQKMRQQKKIIENKVKKQPVIKQVPKNKYAEQNLTFDSDLQDEITQAFRTFPKSNAQTEDNKSNLEWAVKIQAKEIGIISALYEQLGNSYDDYDDFQLAKRAYKIARKGYIKQSGQNCEKEMNLLINLGNIYAKLNQFQKSIKCLKKCALIARKLNDIETEVMAYKNCGNVALHSKDTNTAQMCYIRCLKIIQEMQKSPNQELPIIYTNLSNVYLMNEQYKKSNECIEEYMRIVPKKTGLKAGVLYFNWGFGLLHLNQFIEAFSKFEIAFKQSYKENMRARIEDIMLNTLRQKRQLIKKQKQDYMQPIVRVRKLMLSQNQRMLDSIIDGNMV